jgi:hypothetical protein
MRSENEETERSAESRTLASPSSTRNTEDPWVHQPGADPWAGSRVVQQEGAAEPTTNTSSGGAPRSSDRGETRNMQTPAPSAIGAPVMQTSAPSANGA